MFVWSFPFPTDTASGVLDRRLDYCHLLTRFRRSHWRGARKASFTTVAGLPLRRGGSGSGEKAPGMACHAHDFRGATASVGARGAGQTSSAGPGAPRHSGTTGRSVDCGAAVRPPPRGWWCARCQYPSSPEYVVSVIIRAHCLFVCLFVWSSDEIPPLGTDAALERHPSPRWPGFPCTAVVQVPGRKLPAWLATLMISEGR